MEKNGHVSTNSGYTYTIRDKMDDDLTMVKNHIDDCILFQDRMTESKFGGNLSVRKSEDVKPIFMFGQNKYGDTW